MFMPQLILKLKKKKMLILQKKKNKVLEFVKKKAKPAEKPVHRQRLNRIA